MTQQTASGSIPALTLGWRLRMALDYSRTPVHAMANQLGVTRATLSRWMSDKGSRPKKAYVMQWALITGVPFEWIDTGKVPVSPDDPDGADGARHPSALGGSPTGQYPQLPLARLLHLPEEIWPIAAQTPPTTVTLTKSSTGLAA